MKIVYIEWIDSVSLDDGWAERHRIMELEPVLIKSIGFLIKETEDYIILCSHYNDFTGCGEIAIPKCSLKKKKVINHG